MYFEIKVSALRNAYVRCIDSALINSYPHQIFLCIFIESFYNLSGLINEPDYLCSFLPSEMLLEDKSSSHGIQGSVTYECQQMLVNLGAPTVEECYGERGEIRSILPHSNWDWTRTERIAFRIGLLDYILQNHGDVDLEFNYSI